MQLQLAAQLRRNGTPIDPDQLEAMHAESRAAIDELRELARGVYPSVLTERGLHDALRSVARRSPKPVEVAYDRAVAFSAEDAAAVYFICLEALQNIAKHAGPDATAQVSVRVCAGDLIVSVVDDGPGFDRAALGTSRGMLNMADRASALGGELIVDSSPGRGTRISIVVPDWPAVNVGA